MLKNVLGKNVLVEPDPFKLKTKAGLLIPAKKGAKAQRSGTVVSVGSEVENPIQKGDKVYFKVYSGNELKIDGKDYMIFIEDNILAKVG
jgi:chaperonin GroES